MIKQMGQLVNAMLRAGIEHGVSVQIIFEDPLDKARIDHEINKEVNENAFAYDVQAKNHQIRDLKVLGVHFRTLW